MRFIYHVYGMKHIIIIPVAASVLLAACGDTQRSMQNRDSIAVTAFDQTTDGSGNERSAKRIFGKYFDIYQNIHSNQEVREAARKEAIKSYCSKNGINAKAYKDYGWPAVLL